MFKIIENNHSYENNFLPVGWDTYEVGFGNEILGTVGLETCVGVSLYDPFREMGIVTHVTGHGNVNEDYSPNRIVDTILNKLSRYTGVNILDLEASICGERTFKGFEPVKSQVIENRFNELGIKIIGKDIGNCFFGRSMFLDCSNGNVEVYRPKSL